MPRPHQPLRPVPTARRRRPGRCLGRGRPARAPARRLALLLAPVALLGGAAPAARALGGPAPASARLRPLDRWDEAALRWLAPAVGVYRGALPPAWPRAGTAPGPDARAGAIVRRLFLAGDRIARLPYKWGGGHAAFADTGYDCSGSVSYVLHAAGLLGAPQASGDLTGYGLPGPGRRVTVYANAQHALISIDGRRFDTITLQETGSRWAPRVGALSGYVLRHPRGL